MALKEMFEKLKSDGIQFIRFESPDIHGIARGKTLPIKQFQKFASNGLNCCMIPATAQSTILLTLDKFNDCGFPDSYIVPDLSTYALLPWVGDTARFICDINRGPMSSYDARGLAKTQLSRLQNMGYSLYSGFEMEFMMMNENCKPLYPGTNYMCTLRNGFDQQLVNKILRCLEAIKIDCLTANAEYGPGQFEMALAPSFSIKSADDAFSFKTSVKEMFRMHRKIATFMTKPFEDSTANGQHFSHSVWSSDGNSNIFYDSSRNGLSEFAQHWLSGLINHSAALCALCQPTSNCSKRTRDYSFAPTTASWSEGNRCAAYRVKTHSSSGTYIENRLVSGCANPYIAMAATIAAGLDGVDRRLELPPQSTGMIYGESKISDQCSALPTKLEARLEALQNDKVITEALGEDFVNFFVAIKRYELELAEKEGDKSNDAPTQWEREMFLEFC